MNRNRLFHPLDLVFPIGFGVLGLVLAVWSLFSDAPAIGKIIAAATGLVFASMNIVLYSWRIAARRADFTYRGVRVRLGTENRPARVVIKAWIDWTINWWASGTRFNEPEIEKALDSVLLVFVDQYKLGSPGAWMRGYYQGNAAVVGYQKNNLGYGMSLVAHELGHAILDGLRVVWEAHHELMEAVEYDTKIAATAASNVLSAPQATGSPDPKQLDRAFSEYLATTRAA